MRSELASLYVSTHFDGYECRQSEDGTVRRTVERIVPCRRTSLSKIASSPGVHLLDIVVKEHDYEMWSRSREMMNRWARDSSVSVQHMPAVSIARTVMVIFVKLGTRLRMVNLTHTWWAEPLLRPLAAFWP